MDTQDESMDLIDLTPTPQLLQILGDLKFKGWQCIAELIDNSIDAILGSRNILPENKRIIVTIPTPGKLRAGDPVLVEDFADGMKEESLQNAVKAGYSGKNTRDSIGLFGMGFNVATACLANKVEVWSSTEDMKHEIGVLIDLKDMAASKSFMRRKLERPKRYDKKSGTEIKIYDFKQGAESLLRVGDIKYNLMRAYTERIFKDHGISIKINQFEIQPFKFCVWSENVMVRVKYDDIPAFFEIDKVLRTDRFCENCRTWLGEAAQTSLQVECPSCHTTDQIVTKEVQLVGWLGIQRYPDPDHYGIDISRNGRILRKLDKSLFFWEDERAMNDPRFHPEYPRDNELYNGRIVGQIEANFVIPRYTKDDFNSDDENWKVAVRYLRGEMPLQTDLGAKYGYSGLNRTPIGLLFRGYRRIDPPGLKTLMFAKNDGSGKSDPIRQKNWREKFYEFDPVYVDEKTWLKEIE
ncbi:MAG: ATP-binding protein, partial [Candidatus Paceibacterota bacterium]